MILTGTDIISISRFDEKRLANKSFLNRCFTAAEQEYCLSRGKPAQHFAARFAGKEAVVKALSGLDINIDYRDIEILNRKNGRPYVTFHSKDEKILALAAKCDISLSHSETDATAFAVIDLRDD
ncbi:MAG: holo-ACP synthase [Methanomicrobium sp.]|nr:holo-ACP synthase [Methanomicrobium sp.]